MCIRDRYLPMGEGWSKKYKDSIDCNNPKGFSQKAHCQGKKKKEETVLEKWFTTVFSWLERCEEEFGFVSLKGYDTERLYAYLAERYLSFWFTKYTSYREHPWAFIDF